MPLGNQSGVVNQPGVNNVLQDHRQRIRALEALHTVPGDSCALHFGSNDVETPPYDTCPAFVDIDFFANTSSGFSYRGGAFLFHATGGGLQVRVDPAAVNANVLIWNEPTSGTGTIRIRADGPGLGRHVFSPRSEAGSIQLLADADHPGPPIGPYDGISLSAKGAWSGIGLYAYDETEVGGTSVPGGGGPITILAAGQVSLTAGLNGTFFAGDGLRLDGGASPGGETQVLINYDGVIGPIGTLGNDNVAVIIPGLGADAYPQKFLIRVANEVFGTNLLEVRADGTYHIRAGATWVADL